MTKVRVLRSGPARLKGLLLTQPTEDVVVLANCSDIHTFGMAYPLDVAFINSKGIVLKAYRSVEPRSRLCCSGAFATLERAATNNKTWFVPGQFAGESIHKALTKGRRYEKVSRM